MNLKYWKEVKNLSLSQAAMLFAGEEPPQDIKESIEEDCSSSFLKYREKLIEAVRQCSLPTQKSTYDTEEVKIEGEIINFDLINPNKTTLNREELAIWAFDNELAPVFLEEEMRDIDTILKKYEKPILQSDAQICDMLAKDFVLAMKEINLLKNNCNKTDITQISLISCEEKANHAKSLFKEQPQLFPHLEEEYISEKWFESDHGTRDSQGLVFTGIAKSKGYEIGADSARKIFIAQKGGLSIPSVIINKIIKPK